MRLASALLVGFLSVVASCAPVRRLPPPEGFALVMTQSPVMDCSSGPCVPRVSLGSGSGTVLWHGKEGTWVLTAGHVCAGARQPDGAMALLSSDGKMHHPLKWLSAIDPDLCIILTADKWGSPVRVSAVEPRWGDPVWSMAAPRGVFMPGAPLLFSGTWSGRDQRGNVIVTMPCAPGSSGSSLLDNRGEIVGVVHSTSVKFQEIAIATRRERVIDFINEARRLMLGEERPADDTDAETPDKLPL